MTDNSKNINNLQEKNEQVLNNISQLQQEEKKLYNSLQDVSLTTEQKERIINKINEISQIRINLYSSLKDLYNFYQNDISDTNVTMKQQVDAIDIIEKELNQSKNKMNLIEEQQNNKLRLVEINTYYGDRYKSYSNVMKTILITCIPIIILVFINNTGILPSIIFQILISIILVLGGWVIGLQLINIYYRNNMNWNEYTWYFNPDKAPSKGIVSDSSFKNPWAVDMTTCVGEACCYENSIYDSERNICVPNSIYKQEQTNKLTN